MLERAGLGGCVHHKISFNIAWIRLSDSEMMNDHNHHCMVKNPKHGFDMTLDARIRNYVAMSLLMRNPNPDGDCCKIYCSCSKLYNLEDTHQ